MPQKVKRGPSPYLVDLAGVATTERASSRADSFVETGATAAGGSEPSSLGWTGTEAKTSPPAGWGDGPSDILGLASGKEFQRTFAQREEKWGGGMQGKFRGELERHGETYKDPYLHTITRAPTGIGGVRGGKGKEEAALDRFGTMMREGYDYLLPPPATASTLERGWVDPIGEGVEATRGGGGYRPRSRAGLGGKRVSGQINESLHLLFEAQARSLERTNADAWTEPRLLVTAALPSTPSSDSSRRNHSNGGSAMPVIPVERSIGGNKRNTNAGHKGKTSEARRGAGSVPPPGDMYELGKSLPSLQRAREAMLASVDWGHVNAVLGSTRT